MSAVRGKPAFVGAIAVAWCLVGTAIAAQAADPTTAAATSTGMPASAATSTSASPPASASAPMSGPVRSPEAARLEKAAPSTGRPIVWTGATIFSVAYIGSALAATTSYTSDTTVTTPHGALWIPVVGPFIVMGKTSGAGNEILLALDGLAQIGGLTLFVYGQTTPKPPRPGSDAEPKVTVSVALLVARGTGGATAIAKF